MDVVRSRVDTGSERFRRTRRDTLALLAEIEVQLALARAGGRERSVARHRERGKLLIAEYRERSFKDAAHEMRGHAFYRVALARVERPSSRIERGTARATG